MNPCPHEFRGVPAFFLQPDGSVACIQCWKEWLPKEHRKLPENGRTFMSSCCHDNYGVCVSVGSDETTWHHECSECKNPCDSYLPPSQKGEERCKECGIIPGLYLGEGCGCLVKWPDTYTREEIDDRLRIIDTAIRIQKGEDTDFRKTLLEFLLDKSNFILWGHQREKLEDLRKRFL